MSGIQTGFTTNNINGVSTDLGDIFSDPVITYNFKQTNITTNRTESILYGDQVSIPSSKILATSGSTINSKEQIYTFGERSHEPRWVATGIGGNTLGYSHDGMTWRGLGTTIFDQSGNDVLYNGKLWVAGGRGTTNSLAYSFNGLDWTGIGRTATIGLGVNSVCWNGKLWVAGGNTGTTSGANAFAYSYDGINWRGAGNNILQRVNSIAWNGEVFMAAGSSNANTLATSSDGITWTGLGNVVPYIGQAVKWNGNSWLAGGITRIPYTPSYYYPFNADAYNYATGTGVNDTITTSVAYSTTIKKIGTGSLNLSDTTPKYVSIPINATNNKSNLTISCWVYFNPGQLVKRVIVAPSAYLGYGVLSVGSIISRGSITQQTTGVVYWQSYDEAFSGAPLRIDSGVSTLVQGAWYHVAVTIAPNKAIIYLNGINCGESTIGTWVIPKDNVPTTCKIGYYSYSGNNSDQFNGYIDDFRIYNNTLSASEISTIYNYLGTDESIFQTSISRSINNTTWTTVPQQKLYNIQSIKWNGTVWVAGGIGISDTIMYSSDGTNWNSVKSSTTLFSTACHTISWNGTIWLAGGEGTNNLAYSYDGITWNGLNSTIFSTAVYGIDFNRLRKNQIIIPKDTVVATSKTATNNILYSYDKGTTWTPVSFFTSSGNCVKFNGKLWVAGGKGSVSGNNTMAYSYDGKKWNVLGNAICSTECLGIETNGYIWVSVGSGTNNIGYSYDGISWIPATSASTAIGTGAEIRGVVYTGKAFVLGAISGNRISYSSDGINWNVLNSYNDVAYNGIVSNGINTLAYGSYYYRISDNTGQTWGSVIDISNILTDIREIAYHNGLWVMVGAKSTNGNTIAYSTNATSWKASPSLNNFNSSNAAASVKWIGDRFLATGSSSSSQAYSFDGINWTSSTTSFTGSGRGLEWSDNKPNKKITKIMVAGGGSTTNSLAYSLDGGITWRGLGKNVFTSSVNSICYNGKMFVAVADSITGSATENTLGYSYDGLKWTGLGQVFKTGRTVSWNGSVWVAVGGDPSADLQGKIIYSTNGVEWTQATHPTSNFSGCFGLAWTGTRWIATSNSSKLFHEILYSDDNGVNWSRLAGSGISDLMLWTGAKSNGYITVVSGRTAAAAYSGNRLFYSVNNGSSWTGCSMPTALNWGVNSVSYNGETWLAVGTESVGTPNLKYLKSTDGISWTENTFPTNAGGVNISGTTVNICEWDGEKWFIGSTPNTPAVNSLLYSYDAVNWYAAQNIDGILGSNVRAISVMNPVETYPIEDTLLVNSSRVPQVSSTFDIVSDDYYQDGHNNITISVNSNYANSS